MHSCSPTRTPTRPGAGGTSAYLLQIPRDGDVPVGNPVDLPLCGPRQRGVEALRWRAFAEGDHPVTGPLRVSPRWSEHGEPAVAALCIEAGGREISLPTSRLFAQAARRESSRLVAAGVLETGAAYAFVVTAEQSPTAPRPPVFHLDDYPIMPGNGAPAGEQSDAEFAMPGDFPVQVAPGVLAAAIRLAEEAGDAETGGVLFGRLLREATGGRPLLEITHLCPAEEGRGAGASFTFTPDTWSRAQAVLTERAADELMVGSYHSHPDFCAKCEPERQQVCALRRPFFSEDDVRLHETVFPAAYSVGLLASHDGARFIPSLWGWRDGFIARRSYLTHI